MKIGIDTTFLIESEIVEHPSNLAGNSLDGAIQTGAQTDTRYDACRNLFRGRRYHDRYIESVGLCSF